MQGIVKSIGLGLPGLPVSPPGTAQQHRSPRPRSPSLAALTADPIMQRTVARTISQRLCFLLQCKLSSLRVTQAADPREQNRLADQNSFPGSRGIYLDSPAAFSPLQCLNCRPDFAVRLQ